MKISDPLSILKAAPSGQNLKITNNTVTCIENGVFVAHEFVFENILTIIHKG